MTENTTGHEHRNQAPIWGIFLLFIGIVLLLQTLNVLPWGLWETLWRFWPALIIILGLAILLRRYSVWLISLLVVIILGASLGIAIWQNNTGGFGGTKSSETFTQPLSSLGNAQVKIDFSAGDLTVDSLLSSSTNLVAAQAETRNNVSSMQTVFSTQDHTGHLSLNAINQQYWPGGGIKWETDFTRLIPLSFDITSAASSTKLNFNDINLAGLTLDLNAGTCNIDLPAPVGVVNTNLKANAANIDISLPSDTAVRITATTNVGSLEISNRFIKQGNVYVTKNYDGATDRYEIEIETNVGRVHVD